jgi:hypothetical protein
MITRHKDEKTLQNVDFVGFGFWVSIFDLTLLRKVRDMNLTLYTTTYQYVILVVKLLLRFSPKFSDFILTAFDFALSCNYFVFKNT